jgi:ribosomal-protein-alanine N-acetyltransferase
MPSPLEFRKLSHEFEGPLAELFDVLKQHSFDRFFAPHRLDAQMARDLSRYVGDDLYTVLVEGDRVLGYGMLRGWDEGYCDPSLGIAIRPGEQGNGLGRLVMLHLHAAAVRRGARRIRLRVHKENGTAIALYQSLGYILSIEANGQFFLGIIELAVKQEKKRGE